MDTQTLVLLGVGAAVAAGVTIYLVQRKKTDETTPPPDAAQITTAQAVATPVITPPAETKPAIGPATYSRLKDVVSKIGTNKPTPEQFKELADAYQAAMDEVDIIETSDLQIPCTRFAYTLAPLKAPTQIWTTIVGYEDPLGTNVLNDRFQVRTMPLGRPLQDRWITSGNKGRLSFKCFDHNLSKTLNDMGILNHDLAAAEHDQLELERSKFGGSISAVPQPVAPQATLVSVRPVPILPMSSVLTPVS